MRRRERLATTLMLVVVLLLGSYLRLAGLDWGEGQAIHPDEEFLRQVTATVRLPDSVGQYFDTENSPLVPYNHGYSFFVYGPLPMTLTRAAVEWLESGCEPPHSLAARLLAPAVIGRPVEECWPGAFSGASIRTIGRALSALFDVGSLVLVFLLGKRLKSSWVGILGALLYALSALPIQQAHFYTVDSFANFFVAVALYSAVRAVRSGGQWDFALGGLATGLGMACKVSVWPLGLLIGLAGLLWARERLGTPGKRLDGLLSVAGRVALAGIVALLAFRTGQPYIVSGSGFFSFRLNPQWLGNMGEVRGLMSGANDYFPGHQWTARTPLLFPWVNMVVWGLGLPLGLAAWAGWALAGYTLLRWWRRRTEAEVGPYSLLLLWIWGTAYFAYQGSQWVKNMRYLLPIYPVFTLLAAWLIARLLERGQSRPRSRFARLLPAAVSAAIVAGSLFWGLALTSVYARSHTRIASSRWMFDNVPTAAAVQLQTDEGPVEIPVVISPGPVPSGGATVSRPFEIEDAGDVTGVTLNYVIDPQADPETEQVRVALAADSDASVVLAEAEQELVPVADLQSRAYLFDLGGSRLVPGSYYLVVEVVSSGPVELSTTVLATEHWDWAPPLRVDGHDPFGGMYRGLSTGGGQLLLYHDDNHEKRTELLDALDEADYIITGSNRLYSSISRLPSRYPLTMAYYEALFSGELGFELVADFTSYLALGPFQFPDQEEPFEVPQAAYEYRAGPISIPLPAAEEAFSVYDHPRVLIFRKTAAYSRQQAEDLMPASLLDEVIWVTPRQATAGLPLFEGETWAQQQSGGTWSDMFNRDSLLNRTHWVAAAVWYVAAALLGLLAFPLLFKALPNLRDRGYGLARPIGLLLVAYMTWLSASVRVLPSTRGTISLMVLLLAAVGGVVGWRSRREITAFLRSRGRILLWQEAIILILFLAWCWARAANPDLWHPVVGGEKPMDFAYLNAVIRSTWFPPYDPWFSGGTMNYYYYGFVLVAVFSKLLGIMPSIAYNLAIAFFFAITGGVSFSVAFNLASGDSGQSLSKRPYAVGVLAVLFVLVLGNLGELRLLANTFYNMAGAPAFDSTIPGFSELVQVLRGFWQLLRGQTLPIRPETPYWEPTRMLPWPAFAEFPAFTFLYGDPHAHMFALPYTITILGIALAWARGGWRSIRSWLPSCAIGALATGSLLAINTWDFPTYLIVGLTGLALGVLWDRFQSAPAPVSATTAAGEETVEEDGAASRPPLAAQSKGTWRRAAALGWRAVLYVWASVLMFIPFIQNYVPAVGGVVRFDGDRIPLLTYLLILGQFLFPLAALLIIDGRTAAESVLRSANVARRLALALGLVGTIILTVGVGVGGVPLAYVAIPIGLAAATMGLAGEQPVERRLVWLLLFLGMCLTLVVELVSVGGDRMNTVFKFYYQVWTLLAIGGAAAAVWVTERSAEWPIRRRDAWMAAMGILLVSMALFPIMSIPAKLGDRITHETGLTLDGMAYVQYGTVGDVRGGVDLAPDYSAIVWLQDNVEGSPVILEGLGEREYLWGSRVSIYTGLPTVVGWRWHQVQQRMRAGGGEVEQRHADVNACYSTTDRAQAWEILQRYGVRYVYVGPYERLYYDARGLAKFDRLVSDGLLRVVYNQEGVSIYEVLP